MGHGAAHIRMLTFMDFSRYDAQGCHRFSHFMYFTFQSKRIVLFDTLIKQVEMPELLAILGHEIGHWKLGHTIQGFVISQVGNASDRI